MKERTVHHNQRVIIVPRLKTKEIRISKTGRRMRYVLSYFLVEIASITKRKGELLLDCDGTTLACFRLDSTQQPISSWLPMPRMFSPPLFAKALFDKGRGTVHVGVILLEMRRWVGSKGKGRGRLRFSDNRYCEAKL